jgi:hypothetical protein
MMPTDSQLRRIADAVVTALIDQDLIELSGTKDALRDRIVAALLRNFTEELEIEDEAEAFAKSHRREMVGMDQSKVIELVKQRIAKERGFIL